MAEGAVRAPVVEELAQVLAIATHYEAKMEELIPVIVEIRELLIDQWEENKREALEE